MFQKQNSMYSLERVAVVKYRTGFVSNSSTSSYVCDICNKIFSGWDEGLEEFGLYSCRNGHTFCEEHAKEKIHYTKERLIELFEKEKSWIGEEDMKDILATIERGDEDEIEEILVEYLESGRCDVAPEQCPLCSLIEISDSDRIDYLMIRGGYDYGKLLKEIRERFKNYDGFKQHLRENIPITKT